VCRLFIDLPSSRQWLLLSAIRAVSVRSLSIENCGLEGFCVVNICHMFAECRAIPDAGLAKTVKTSRAGLESGCVEQL